MKYFVLALTVTVYTLAIGTLMYLYQMHAFGTLGHHESFPHGWAVWALVTIGPALCAFMGWGIVTTRQPQTRLPVIGDPFLRPAVYATGNRLMVSAPVPGRAENWSHVTCDSESQAAEISKALRRNPETLALVSFLLDCAANPQQESHHETA
jgi:hypothetical protein